MASRPFEPARKLTRAEKKAAELRAQRRKTALKDAGIDQDTLNTRSPYDAFQKEKSPTKTVSFTKPDSKINTAGFEEPFLKKRSLNKDNAKKQLQKPFIANNKDGIPSKAMFNKEKSVSVSKISQEVSRASAGRKVNFGVVIFSIGTMGLIFLRLPVLAHSEVWKVITAGVLLVLFGLFWTWRYSHIASLKSKMCAGIIGSVLISAFTWGTFSSVIINNKVYASNSDTAKAWRISHALNKDLNTLHTYALLLTYDSTKARTNYEEYKTGEDAVTKVRNKWSKTKLNTIPNGDLQAAVQNTAQAADWEVQALVKKAADALEPDTQVEQDIQNYAVTYLSDYVNAGQSLTSATEAFGFDIRKGPQE